MRPPADAPPSAGLYPPQSPAFPCLALAARPAIGPASAVRARHVIVIIAGIVIAIRALIAAHSATIVGLLILAITARRTRRRAHCRRQHYCRSLRRRARPKPRRLRRYARHSQLSCRRPDQSPPARSVRVSNSSYPLLRKAGPSCARQKCSPEQRLEKEGVPRVQVGGRRYSLNAGSPRMFAEAFSQCRKLSQ